MSLIDKLFFAFLLQNFKIKFLYIQKSLSEAVSKIKCKITTFFSIIQLFNKEKLAFFCFANFSCHLICTSHKKAVPLQRICSIRAKKEAIMYIHLDCNNFFVSCELVSRPELQGKPVVVANDNGNNGGIILALNQEAKAVGADF